MLNVTSFTPAGRCTMMESVPVPILLRLGHSLSLDWSALQRVATARRSSLKPGAVTTSERGMRADTGGASPSTSQESVGALPPARAGVAPPVASARATPAVARQPARTSDTAACGRMRDEAPDMGTPLIV